MLRISGALAARAASAPQFLLASREASVSPLLGRERCPAYALVPFTELTSTPEHVQRSYETRCSPRRLPSIDPSTAGPPNCTTSLIVAHARRLLFASRTSPQCVLCVAAAGRLRERRGAGRTVGRMGTPSGLSGEIFLARIGLREARA
mmetsp:Transcript_6645/g.20061  ORF Transcript_6645/g.20061 Transcript_6645/m.20061 type:complete len:148 (-) Transcript_6645:200-643(-)|eukprot:scaffold38244_cov30-Tisochrysis_lutea.AAC.5